MSEIFDACFDKQIRAKGHPILPDKRMSEMVPRKFVM